MAFGEWTWRCDACGDAIDRGFILLSDPKRPGCYPTWREADDETHRAAERAWWAAYEAEHGQRLAVSLADLMTLPDQPARCLVETFHRACVPYASHEIGDAYWLRVEEHDDRELLDTVAHLLGKTWFGAEEAITLIRKYQDGRSRALRRKEVKS